MRIAKIIWLGSFIFLSVRSADIFAQINPIRQADKKMAQRNWIGAHQLLREAMRKDTLSVEAELLQSRWFFESGNPEHQIDSAYHYSLVALRSFRNLTQRQREKLGHGIDSAFIISWRMKIDSAALNSAKQVNTEKSYNDFLAHYLYASGRGEAVELRDEAAYLDVLKQNTYQSFENYFQRYPKSHRANEAHARYEKLLFDARTHDKKLKSYQAFVKEFPGSPFRREADENIFEMLTSSGLPDSFIKFISNYPQNYYAGFARDILFHITRESEEKLPEEMLTDSLRKVNELNRFLWAPIYKNGKYGFIDSRGNEMLPPQYAGIDESYKCGSISSDILMTNAGSISRSGKVISTKPLVKDLGYGFMKVADGSCVQLLHKSGRLLLNDCLQDAFVLGGSFLIIKKNDVFGICAFSGRVLLSPQWQSIEMMEGVVILDRNGKKTLCKPSHLAAIANGNTLPETLVFDDVKIVGVGRLLVRNGSLEGIINSNLEYVVPLAMQSLVPTRLGMVRKINEQFVFADVPQLGNKKWDYYYFHGQWLHLRDESGEKLYDIYSKKIIESAIDSLWFSNRLAFVCEQDSVKIFINSSDIISVPRESNIHFIKSSDSIRFFYTEQKNKKNILVKNIFSTESGKKIFTTDVDIIESLNTNLFVVTRKNKKGLLNLSGKTVLSIEYDALVLNEKFVSLYKEKKFGLFAIESAKLLKPSFERNLFSLNDSILIAFKDGHYGLIDWQTNNITAFDFDEIQPWNEFTIWTKKDFEWSLIDFRNKSKTLAHIKSYSLIKNEPKEKLAIVKQENFFGVVSTDRGVIIPPSFSLIVNLGNEDQTFYFTSKEVEEAGIVVVIYYDHNGKLLRKQVYEEEEYEKVVCPQD